MLWLVHFQTIKNCKVFKQYDWFPFRLYSCLANGSADEFTKGEHLYKARAVKDALQIGEFTVRKIRGYWNVTVFSSFGVCCKCAWGLGMFPLLEMFHCLSG